MTVARLVVEFRAAALCIVALSLCSCLREDPQLQLLRAELQQTQQALTEAKEESGTSRLTAEQKEALSQYSGLRREHDEIKRKLSLVSQELETAKVSAFRVLEEPELYASLERAAAPLKEQVKADYHFDLAGVKELQRPDISEYPYSCILFLEVTRRADNQPLEAPIPVKADREGRWTFPEMPQIVGLLQPRGFYSRQRAVAPAPSPTLPPSSSPNPAPSLAPAQPSPPGRPVPSPNADRDSTLGSPRPSAPSPPPPVPNVVYKKRFNWGD